MSPNPLHAVYMSLVISCVFSRQTLPQRKSILQLVMRGEAAADDIDFNRLAKLTDGFTGETSAD